MDAREAVVTTGVGRGGGGVLGVAWAQGRGISEERKEEDGPGIYRPYPFTPGAIPPPGGLVTRTGSKGFFWRATKLQPTFTHGWASHPGVKVACSFVSRLF